MNLLSLVERFGREETANFPELDSKRCLHYRDRLDPCTVCADLCPVEAISFAESSKLPRIDPELCRHCMACLPACPTGAFTADDAVPDLVRCAELLHSEQLEVMCIHHPDLNRGPGDAAVRVRGCLAGLGSGAYLTLAARGVPAVSIRVDACNHCPWGNLQTSVGAQVARAEAVLNLWDNPTAFSLVRDTEATWQERPVYRAESPPFTRRALAQMAREPEGEHVISGKQPFHERLRTLGSLQHLPPLTESTLTGTLPAEAGFAIVYVDDACSACGTCGRACPAGALAVEVTDDWFRLTLASQACLACDVCAHLCPEEAIVVDHEPIIAGIFGETHLFLLHEGEARRCARCNAPFAPRQPDDKHCEICDFRRKNRLGTKVPPGIAQRALRRNNAR